MSLIYCRYYVGRQPVIFISDVELIKAITVKDFEHFVDRHASYYLLLYISPYINW